jgi:chaperonin GroES
MTNLVPMQDNIIVSPIEEEFTTSSGIIIPDTISKEKPMRGKIVAIGAGKKDAQGVLQTINLKKDDIVIFTKYAPTEIKVEGKEFYIIGFDSVLAVEK